MYKPIIFLLFAIFAASKLQGYNAYLNETTVAGLSSGAFFAVQMHFAYSQNMKGAAIHAGGPYYCAKGAETTAITACMNVPLEIDVDALTAQAQSFASSGKIDSLDNIKGQPVYLFSGTKDTVVHHGVMEKAEKMYTNLGAKVTTRYDIPAQHSYVTDNYGNQCSFQGSPYINNCNFNAAYESMSVLFPGLKNGTQQVDSNLIEFSQSEYTSIGYSMGEKAYVYVPTACQQGAHCKVHLQFHGCQQTLADIGKDYVSKLGVNEIAEANNIIVLYPQAKKSTLSPSNPQGCWDWWGYTDSLMEKTQYVTKEGKQMKAIWNMVTDLCAGAKFETQ